MVYLCHGPCIAARPCVSGVDRVTGFPARPAAYIRDLYATTAGDSDVTRQRDMVIDLVQDLGWPVPAVYADLGQSGSQLAALVEAISAGRHDAVYVTHPRMIGGDSWTRSRRSTGSAASMACVCATAGLRGRETLGCCST